MSLAEMKREIARAARITTKIVVTEETLQRLYEERRGLARDQFFVWCPLCGRNPVPMGFADRHCDGCCRRPR